MNTVIYCSHCGAENEADATYCRKCGQKLDKQNVNINETMEPKEPVSGHIDVDRNGSPSGNNGIAVLIASIVGALIVVIILAVGGHSFYLNHRSEQATANIAQNIADKDFGSDEVRVYYSKSKNSFTIKTLSDSDARSNLHDYFDSYDDNQDRMNDLISDYKSFINDINDRMGSKYKSYYTGLEDPWNHSKIFIDSTGTKVTFDGLNDN